MKNIIAYFNKIQDKDFIDCRVTSMRDFFGYNNLYLDSFDIFILGRIIDCALLKFKLKKDSPLELCLLGGSKLEIEQELFEFLGIKYNKKNFTNDIKSEIKDYIDKGIPILSRFDIRYIYNPNLIINKKYDIHCLSSTVICGYDFDDDCIYIELNEKRQQPLKKVKISDFVKAVSSPIFPLEVKRTYFTTEIEPGKVKEIKENLNNLLWNALKNTAESMFAGREFVLENNYEYKKIRYGLNNLKEIIKANNELEHSLKNSKINYELKMRISSLYSLTMRDMMTPGSNYCFRYEFGESLINMSKKLNEKKLEQIGIQFKKISKLWRELTRTLTFRIKQANEEKLFEYFDKVNRIICEIYDSESEQFEKLYKLTSMNAMVK